MSNEHHSASDDRLLPGASTVEASTATVIERPNEQPRVKEPPIDVERVLTDFDDLATLAPVALRVLELADQPDVSMTDLCDVIATDPGLSAKLLRLANSAAYSRGAEVASLQRAAMVLGLRTLKLVSLCFTLVDSATDEKIDCNYIWRRSVVTAVLARSVIGIPEVAAQAAEGDPDPKDLGDTAFVAGLLSNIGKVALGSSPEFVEMADRFGPAPGSSMELAYLGVTSDAVTARILHAWRLPRGLAHAVESRFATEADGLPGQRSLIGATIGLADAAAELVLAEDGYKLALAYDTTAGAAAALGLTMGAMEQLIDLARHEVEQLMATFEMEPIGPDEADDIIRSAQRHLARLSLDVAMMVTEERKHREELLDTTRQLAEAASTDVLTGLPNRRAFDTFLKNQIAMRQRHERPSQLGLLIFDLDHFKAVNDTYGHVVGDEVLQGVARRMLDGCRRGELVARIGGEELALVLPDVQPEDLYRAADRVRRLISDEPFACSAATISVTVSVGGASTAHASDDTYRDLVVAADAELYRAKDGGRNFVSVTELS